MRFSLTGGKKHPGYALVQRGTKERHPPRQPSLVTPSSISRQLAVMVPKPAPPDCTFYAARPPLPPTTTLQSQGYVLFASLAAAAQGIRPAQQRTNASSVSLTGKTKESESPITTLLTTQHAKRDKWSQGTHHTLR